jgi:hypothetical protein
MPSPEPFRLRIPHESPKTDIEHATNWRRVVDWDQRLAPTGRTRIGFIAPPSPVASVTFSNIPQTFNNLIMECNCECSGVAGTRRGIFIQFNGDTGANYWWQVVGSINGAAPISVSAAAATSATIGNCPGTTASRSGIASLRMLDYTASTSLGTPFFHTGLTENALWDTVDFVTFHGGVWHQHTDPITSLTVIPEVGNWIAPSTFYLYGEY